MYTERLPHSECGEVPTSGFAHTLEQSCHMSHSVATLLRIIVSQKKKSVPELNDQPTYVISETVLRKTVSYTEFKIIVGMTM